MTLLFVSFTIENYLPAIDNDLGNSTLLAANPTKRRLQDTSDDIENLE